MSATDALTITSALDALTRYYCAKEREESAVLYINDAYLEVLNSLENLEAENDKLQNDADLLRAMLSQVQTEKRCYMAENAKLRELVRDMWIEGMCECGSLGKCESCIYDYPSRMRELGIEVDE